MLMLIISHVVIALLSMLVTGLLYLRPSSSKLISSYVLVASTLVSGTYLVISTHSPMVSSCITGVIYLTAVSLVIALSRHKLALAKNKL